mmetsp:Transcript_96304/g.272268  ORF Transcript_96304/g.272268 Transcript_96304/m.272268 type:complete len:219 (-) Transcript_96304:1505-2161(-)
MIAPRVLFVAVSVAVEPPLLIDTLGRGVVGRLGAGAKTAQPTGPRAMLVHVHGVLLALARFRPDVAIRDIVLANFIHLARRGLLDLRLASATLLREFACDLDSRGAGARARRHKETYAGSTRHIALSHRRPALRRGLGTGGLFRASKTLVRVLARDLVSGTLCVHARRGHEVGDAVATCRVSLRHDVRAVRRRGRIIDLPANVAIRARPQERVRHNAR